MKKKGFTLIELLAVIVVLAIIALISTPIILNVIEKAGKGAFEDSAYGVIDAARLYYANASLDKGVKEETFTFPSDTKLKLSGKKPESGSAVLYEDGKVALAISNNKWCAVKEKEKEKISITDYSIDDCVTKEEVQETPESCFIVNENDKSEIIGYTCSSTVVKIPKEINGVEIKKIGDNAFKDKGLTEVIIPKGITSIGSSAFEGNLLTRVEIPGTVETIGDRAFANNQLTEVIIGDGVKHIGSGAFEGNQLTSVKIPGSVETIGDNAFKDNHLTNVEIEEGVKNIGSGAFAGNDLTNVKIPDSVENIGEGAFDNNKGPVQIETNTKESCFIVNPEDPSEITGYVCESKIISIPKGINGVEIKKIGENAFKDKGLTHVTIPEGIISIGASAFEGNQLTKVEIPGSVETIGDNAFKNNQLTEIILNEGLKSIGSGAFEGNQLTNVKIPSTVTDIGENAFKNNQLTKVEVPDETNIGEGAFDGNDLSSTDQTKAEIKNVNIKTTSTTITVTIEAEVGKFGKIKEYEYSIDGGTYKKGTSTYTFENLEFESEHEIGIKVITDSGLVTEKSVTATTKRGVLSVTANGYSGVYDGGAHGITVTSSGATIKYGTNEGTYNLESSPAYTDVGTYTIYYEVTRDKYKTLTGSKEVTITKAEGSISLSETSGSLTYPNTKTITVTKNTGGGALSCTSSSSSVATCQVSGTTVTITPGTTAGTASITITSASTKNYNEATATYTATTASGILSVTANGYSGHYDGTSHGISVSSSGATIKYGTTAGTYNLDSSPTYTNPGTYTVYYEVTKVGYKTVTGSKDIVISKANGEVNLSETRGTVTYPTSKTITVTKNTSGGSLSCTSSNNNIATCSISGTNVTITPGTTAGTASITVTSAGTSNYNTASVSYSANVENGLLSVTANGYSGHYDGNVHGISVTSSGATIKYGTSEGAYSLTNSPTYSNEGIYTVYYEITKVGYKTVTGSKKVIIAGESCDAFTLDGYNLEGRVCYISSDTPIQIFIAGGTCLVYKASEDYGDDNVASAICNSDKYGPIISASTPGYARINIIVGGDTIKFGLLVE